MKEEAIQTAAEKLNNAVLDCLNRAAHLTDEQKSLVLRCLAVMVHESADVLAGLHRAPPEA